ncbi:hypothetical protein FIBSPDRAFT_874032, partial [Athelia psychrophila]
MSKYKSLLGEHAPYAVLSNRLYLVTHPRLPSTHLPALPYFTPTARCTCASVVLRASIAAKRAALASVDRSAACAAHWV